MSEYRFVAPVYDLLLSPFLADIRRHIRDIVKSVNPEKVLDVCCGTGDQLRLLKAEGFDAVGIDLSEAMLGVSQKGENAPSCFNQDATKMDFADASFDFAILTLALHGTAWSNAQKMLSEIHRVLKKDGYALIVDYALGEKTGGYARAVIKLIEFIAGGDHYRNFRYYNKMGGLKALIDKNQFSPIKDKYRGSKSIILKLVQKKN